MRNDLPPELEKVRERARRAIGPVKPVDDATQAEQQFLFNAKRTNAGRMLPPQHLVYLAPIELLGFRDRG